MEDMLMHDFFRRLPAVSTPTKEEYGKAGAIVDGIITFAKNQNLEGYVVDYAKKQMVYVSDGLAKFCGKAGGTECRWEMKDWAGHIPMEDRKVLVEAYRHGLEWFRSLSPDERMHTTLTYEIHLYNGKKERLFHHKLSPILLTPCGNIWMAACTMKFSAFKTAGHVTAISQQRGMRYTYDPQAQQWKEKGPAWLTPQEKEVLALSARGYTTAQVAKKMCKSEDAVKSCKQKLFKRLEVGSKEEALLMAINLGLV